MVSKFSYIKKLKSRIIALMVAVLFICSCLPVYAAGETPEFVFTGSANAKAALNNLNYTDVKNSDTWAKEAIYSTGALNVLKGNGNNFFGRTNPVSKEEAIAIAYRVAGRETDAQNLGNALKAQNTQKLWSFGYLQLAANEGLITRRELTDALTQDTTTLTADSFRRDAPAQRQEVANWLAKTLKLPPDYGQQKINTFSDWKSADLDKVPYIEAILQKGIMNGDGNGRLNPTQSITREQVAQVIKNGENLILPTMKHEKRTGTIEAVLDQKDYGQGGNAANLVYNVRNANGKLHQIAILLPGTSQLKSEQGGAALSGTENNLVVYKNGQIGNNTLLKAGDRIEYITAPDNSVKYVRVLSSEGNEKYIVAQVNSIDSNSLSMNVSRFFAIDNPNADIVQGNISYKLSGGQTTETYKYTSNVLVVIDGKKADLSSIGAGSRVILTIRDNLITEVRNLKLRMNNVVKGIVEDNNPQLGYITLYNEDGTGTGPETSQLLATYRTFYYPEQNDSEIIKNNQKANIEDIEPGDSVFILTDSDGNVKSISAVDNYVVKYGKVISKKPDSLFVEYDNGTQQMVDVDDNTLVVSDRKLASYSRLKEGDRVKLMLHIIDKFTRVKEITVESSGHTIANIYKGSVSYLDEASNKLITNNLEVLQKGQWAKAERKGAEGIKLSDENSIYFGNSKVTAGRINKYLKNNEAYIAVEKVYGGEERAVRIAFRNDDDTEVLYDDSITGSSAGSSEFSLSTMYNSLRYGPGTIFVKEGRLVSGSSLKDGDTAYVVANRSFDDGDYYAGVVQIGSKANNNLIQIYRARIKEINDGKDFAVDSFSELQDLNWVYANTPKTFKLKNNTRIMGDTGVVGQRDFVGYGTGSFLDKSVYIIAKDTDALLVSTAPYGVYNAKGEIYDITGGTVGEEGTVMQEPTGFKIKKTQVYDNSEFLWNDSDDITLNLPGNSIIMKGSTVIKPSDLKKGDKVRVIKKDDTTTGDAYIVFVE